MTIQVGPQAGPIDRGRIERGPIERGPITARSLAASAPAIRETVLRLQGHAVVADPSGALFWPDEHLLIVADLHLCKGSAYAARRVFLPPYDTAATLERLAAVIARLRPRRVVALGDSFHDAAAPTRLLPHDVQALRALQTGREWLWIAGNHDPAPPACLDGDHADMLAIGRLRLRHEPTPGEAADGEIAGHLHPVAIVGGRGGAVRRRCFVADARRCILPAFGAYAGGLNLHDVAFGRLFLGAPHAHVLGRSAVYTVAAHQCLADAHGAAFLWR